MVTCINHFIKKLIKKNITAQILKPTYDQKLETYFLA